LKLLRGWNLRMAWGRESSLEAVGTLVAAASSWGSFLHHPSARGGVDWSWGWCGCPKGPLSNWIPIRSAHRWYQITSVMGFKDKTGRRIPPLPQIQDCKSVKPSPPAWKRGLSGSDCPLDVRQNPSKDTHFPSYGRRSIKPNQTKNSLVYKENIFCPPLSFEFLAVFACRLVGKNSRKFKIHW